MSSTLTTRLPFVPADDPVIPLPPPEAMERALAEHPEPFIGWLKDRQERIERRVRDPYGHGHEPAIWHVVDDLLCRGVKVHLLDPVANVPREILGGSEVYISGGNRSSKSEFAASRVVRTLVNRSERRAWCFHTTGPSSTAMQQPRVWKYLPLAWKQLRKHPTADIKYSQKNGFAGATPTFVGPNGSQCWFKNYAQGIDTIEGEELDICWMDELVPMPWIDAVRFRLADRKGLLIITFTAVEGYTGTVKELTDAAEDVLRVPATLLPILDDDGRETGRVETVPRVQQAKHRELKIVYFHIFDNVFTNQQEVINKARAKGREGILLRCYGVPTKAIGAMYPTFRRDVHVISREFFAKHCQDGTNYQLCDPCSGRNWFAVWARALPDEHTIVIYREWPSPGQYIAGVGDPGWWAESDGVKPDGKKGPAQKPWGFGQARYIEEFLRMEGWREAETAAAVAARNAIDLPRRGRQESSAPPEVIWARYMDSRYGNAPTVAKSETITLIESLDELGMTFEPTPGEHQNEGIEQVRDLLYYDATREVRPDNRPRLLVVENCKNCIWALENWTGMDGQHGACKDPADLIRYLALLKLQYYSADALRPRGGGAY